MNWPEYLQKVSDQAVQTFAGVGAITGVAPVHDVSFNLAVTADFDFLAAVANHLYYIENISIVRTANITGNPKIEAYDIAAAAQTFFTPALVGIMTGTGNFFCTRLAHLNNGATLGGYTMIYFGLDLTYT